MDKRKSDVNADEEIVRSMEKQRAPRSYCELGIAADEQKVLAAGEEARNRQDLQALQRQLLANFPTPHLWFRARIEFMVNRYEQ